MTTYHLLVKPVAKSPRPPAIIWLAVCGLRLELPPQAFAADSVVRTPDNYGDQIIECAGCYSGREEDRSDKQIEAELATDAQATFDGDLGDVTSDVEQTDAADDQIISEENDEYPA